MDYAQPLTPVRLIRRYKRFLADVVLPDGATVTAHCANSGSLKGVATEDVGAWVSRSDNPKRKLAHTLEQVDDGGARVGVHSALANRIAGEAVAAGAIPELAGYDAIRREVKYGERSRIDLLLESDGRPPCYVEIKSVTMRRSPGLAEFPDAVTTRGAKHLGELSAMVADGARAVMLYVVQRSDCAAFAIAGDLDPGYATAWALARQAGVECFVYQCVLNDLGITIGDPLTVEPDRKLA